MGHAAWVKINDDDDDDDDLLLLFSIAHSLFHSRLKTFLFCESFPLQPFFFFFRTDYMIPQTFYGYFWAYPFLLFSFSVLHFLVVGSVW